jgi:hypothetical protein
MMRRTALVCFAFAAVLLNQPASAASDPFVGKWRLDLPRSKIVDDFQVKALGSNRYAFNFEGAPTETVVADGSDQPGLPGTTLAVKARDAHHLSVVRKQDGRVIVSANWTLSRDGRTLRDDFTSLQPDSSKSTTHYLYKRLSGGSGFAGAWESTTPPNGLKIELEIQPYGSNGLRFVSPGSDKRVTFDGRDYPVADNSDGQTMSGRRHARRALDYMEKTHGKITRTRHFAVSRDGRTLTETVNLGQTHPTIFVFARE